MKKAVDPNRLTKFFDSQPMTYSWDTNQRTISHEIPVRTSPFPHLYDATVYDESQPFYKLDEQQVRYLPKEQQREGTLLIHKIEKGEMPETMSEKENDRMRDTLQNCGSNNVTLGLSRERYFNFLMHDPEVVIEKPELKETVMTPAERKAENDREIRIQEAERVRRKAVHDDLRRRYLMHHRHNRGVFCLDAPTVEDTMVYGEEQELINKENERRCKHNELREYYLSERIDPEVTHGYHPFKSCEGKIEYDKSTQIFQSKGRAGPVYNTYNRIIPNDPPYVPDPVRQQWLRYNDTRDKGYNIVSGAEMK